MTFFKADIDLTKRHTWKRDTKRLGKSNSFTLKKCHAVVEDMEKNNLAAKELAEFLA